MPRFPVSDPKTRDNEALRWAAASNHVEYVRELSMTSVSYTVNASLPVSNPNAEESYALRRAVFDVGGLTD